MTSSPRNTITVSIPFDFKGENHKPSVVLDLDDFVAQDLSTNSLVNRVARDNRIDPYSYEYEVLEASPMVFSKPVGKAVDFLNDGCFDFDGFKQYFDENKLNALLQGIVDRYLGVDLTSDKNLKQAMQAAYKAGQRKK